MKLTAPERDRRDVGERMQVLAEGLRFPEGPVALDDGSVLVVEIERQTLSRVTPDGRVEVVAHVPGGPNGAALGPNGTVFVCNNGGFEWHRDGLGLRPHGVPSSYVSGSIDVVDLATGKVERLYDRCGEFPLRGPNDLVFDAFGGFYFTDLGKRADRHMDRGFVYWARADGSEIREVVQAMTTPNGVGLSPDGAELYVAETDTGRIWAFEVTGPGQVRKRTWPSPSGGRLVVGLGGYRRFDSLAVAGSGTIYAAGVESCSIVEVPPDGSYVRDHPAPDLLTTNICFGGPDMRAAYITLSQTGKLVTDRWREPGLRLQHQA